MQRYAAFFYFNGADSTQPENPVAYEAMEVSVTGWEASKGYSAPVVLQSGAANWQEPGKWVLHEVTFSVNVADNGIAIESSGEVYALEGYTDIAAVEVRYYAYDANNSPIRFYLDVCTATEQGADASADAKNLVTDGGFEQEAEYGPEIAFDAFRENNASLSRVQEVAFGGTSALKVAERTNADAGAVYRFPELDTYNMTVYSASTYVISVDYFVTDTFYVQIIAEITGYDGQSYCAPVYLECDGNGWTEKGWKNFSMTFHVEKTDHGVNVSAPGGKSAVITGAVSVAAVDIYFKGWDSANAPREFYLDNLTVLRAPVLFGDSNGGTAGNIVSAEVPAGEKIVDHIATLSEPTKEGYTFAGWSINKEDFIIS